MPQIASLHPSSSSRPRYRRLSLIPLAGTPRMYGQGGTFVPVFRHRQFAGLRAEPRGRQDAAHHVPFTLSCPLGSPCDNKRCSPQPPPDRQCGPYTPEISYPFLTRTPRTFDPAPFRFRGSRTPGRSTAVAHPESQAFQKGVDVRPAVMTGALRLLPTSPDRPPSHARGPAVSHGAHEFHSTRIARSASPDSPFQKHAQVSSISTAFRNGVVCTTLGFRAGRARFQRVTRKKSAKKVVSPAKH
jgi:hypothetical protein